MLAGLLASALALQAQTVTLKSSAGWLESANVQWTTSGTATSYNVYVTGKGLTNQKLDNHLIRNYGTHWRADAIGLAAGSYTLKVVPVVSGTEKTAVTTPPLAVTSHDRSGFAFSGGQIPGAYNLDGTPMSGAVILYLTEKNKDTISFPVQTAPAKYTTYTGIQKILDAFAKATDARPLIVRMVGTVTDAAYLQQGDILLSNGNLAGSHITFEGVGDDATANGWGIRIKAGSRVEVRNLGVMNVNSTAGDNIGVQQDNDHIWVHHTDLFYGNAGTDADQVKGDGALDVKLSTAVTLAYNHFWDNGKASLLGLKENSNTGYTITYHHNWFDHSDSRHPRTRFYSAHVYNNYYDGNAKYGAGSTDSSSLFVEANVFRNCKHPMMISMQGSDLWNEATKANDNDMATFSNEVGGMIKAYNNSITGAGRFVPYGAAGFPNSTVDFDAYVAKSRSETVPATVKSSLGSNIYNNFDTDPKTMYAYVADSPSVVVAKVKAYAGRMNGGDFKWTFNDAVDDTASLVNTALKAALTNYSTSLVSVQGDGSSSSGTVSVRNSKASGTNPICQSTANTLTLTQGWTLLSAELFATNGSRVLATHGSTTVSLEGLKSGVYLARVVTDRGAFEKMILKN
ncbi:MAG: Pectate trisaccharide-lyase precursor [Fibrobacterota bacterium]|jgi:pectate lyase